MANRVKFTPKRREKFLELLRQQPNVSRAARMVAVTRRAVYDWRNNHPDFKAEWDDAVQEGCDLLEEEAWRRACEGYDEPVHYQGERVDMVRRYSDRLMERLLEAHRPEKYARRQELTGPGGEPLAAATVIVLPAEDQAPD